MKRVCAVVLALAALQVVRADEPISILNPTSTSSDSTATSSSSTSASSTASPIFIFDEFLTEDVETCTPLLISWFFTGMQPIKNFTLSVTNINVTQMSPLGSSSYTGGIVTGRQILPSVASGSVLSTGTVSPPPGSSTPLPGLIESLTTSLNASAQNTFTWNPVNLPQGWYHILATATDAGDTLGGVGGVWTTFNQPSETFFIQNGSDVSCLAAIGTSAGTGTGTSTGTSSTTSGAATNTAAPGSSLTTTTSTNRGAIAGGVVGGLAVLVAVLSVYLVFLRGRRNKGRNGLGDDSKSSRPNIGKWGALGSFDSTKGSPKDSRSTSKGQGTDPVTLLNTAANSRSGKSSGLGDMGLAALGLAKNQDAPPSAFTTKPKRNRRSSRQHNPAESAGGMTASSFTSSSFSGDSRYEPYANLGRSYNSMSMSTGGAEEDFVEGRSVPMRNLSPTTSPTEEEEYQAYQGHLSYPPSSDSLSSGAPGVGSIPIAYYSSPFVTPPPSEPTSRHNSRSYSRTSLPSGNSPTQTFGALGASDSSGSSDFQPNRARSQSHHSPTSPRAPDVPESPKHESSSSAHHQKRASSPDAIVYTLNREASQTGSSLGKNQSKRTPRKPVPSYSPQEVQDELSGQPSPPSSPMSPVYTYNSNTHSISTKPAKAGPTRRAAPAPPTESASSSSSSFQRPNPHSSHLHALEHKESAHSLASLRTMEGDLTGYAVVGQEGKKQMHVLIPDMPLPQD